MSDDTQFTRASPRKPILVDARCRKNSWFINQVDLVDISEGGCCISGNTGGLTVGDKIVLRIADLGEVAGNIRWVEEKRAGIAFAEPLDTEVVGDLAVAFATCEVESVGLKSG